MATLYLGTSGFSFDGWKGPFYPAEVKAKGMLAYYATRLPTVEINYTFRQRPSASTLDGWVAATPETFRFSVKAHQGITHVLKLAKAGDATRDFLRRLERLGDRLGPVLFQCPPFLRYDEALLEAFLAELPRGPRYAFEFRHPTWEASHAHLLHWGASACAADTDEAPLATPIHGGPFAYLRLRKTDYDDAELDAWAARVRAALAAGTDVFAYFKHEDEGKGPLLAERLRAKVGA